MMTSDRTQAYGRVMRTLEDMGPSKLHGLEQDVIREAADSLLFAADRSEPDAVSGLANVEVLAGHLTDSGRWSPERVAELLDDVMACGPDAPVRSRA